jgi:hypothetical protein
MSKTVIVDGQVFAIENDPDSAERQRSAIGNIQRQMSGLPPRGAANVPEPVAPDGAGLLGPNVARQILGSAVHVLNSKIEAARRELDKPAGFSVTGQPLPHVQAARDELSSWIDRTEKLIEKIGRLSDADAVALASRCTSGRGGYVLPADYQ